MAETLTENQVCNACGADVRKDALFCYNCGAAVALPQTAAESKEELPADAQLQKQNLEETKNGVGYQSEELKPAFDTDKAVETATDKLSAKSKIQEKNKLESAAAMRQKSKLIQSKKVEVVWEEHVNAPNLWFIFVALALTLLAAVILFLAIRLK